MKYLYIALFAFVGASARYGISLMAGDHSYIGTLFVNVVGAFLLGLLSSYPFKDNLLKTGLTSGLLGSFTTFSTFSMESIHLLENQLALGLSYVVTTFLFGLLFSYAGIKGGQTLW
ncbi:CrcB family protein [Macrococcus hajekii]|uniref:Fluoride-specific ion channel FluC n=1 Tax=Macrococcus hajekii TaxID=198482 RepID=A0A4R6BLM3_9STAP|nr:CrcB family protein [Macrococcus hajekii]TDM02611.1 CrcB family protein [Macrococcus hajekii]GGB02443.1 putative fluoride ion transporter CrcB 1 [Macrococcus hajekii]